MDFQIKFYKLIISNFSNKNVKLLIDSTAFEVARQNGQIQLFADILGDQASQDDLVRIASHYEHERNFLLAGKYYALAGHSEKVCSNPITA